MGDSKKADILSKLTSGKVGLAFALVASAVFVGVEGYKEGTDNLTKPFSWETYLSNVGWYDNPSP